MLEPIKVKENFSDEFKIKLQRLMLESPVSYHLLLTTSQINSFGIPVETMSPYMERPLIDLGIPIFSQQCTSVYTAINFN